ncbi:MAG: hypothetical protein H0U76_08635 [Ktedonobacteraceae bacterium]|nr:hypothetical protein [Ktedonobacteraceae bacterium]
MNEPRHTMTEPTGADVLRQRLVTSMRDSGALCSPDIIRAFATVPREAFVPFFYERVPTTQKMAWVRYDAESREPGEWLELIYRDEPLVTCLDARNFPCSSSSMPSVMARMLEAVQVVPGQRVLEIGTGTGYNAALLASLTGDPLLVTTIEIDPAVAERAATALHTVVGSGVSVQIGDGRQGYAPHAPYERIILTASAPCVAPAWYRQLAPGGRLVMDMQGSLASGFLILEKSEDGQRAHGRFLSTPLHFMPLTSHEAVPAVQTHERLMTQPCRDLFTTEGSPFPEALHDRSFRWWLQWRIPGCLVRKRSQSHPETQEQTSFIFLVDQEHTTILRFQQSPAEEHWHGCVHGSRPLWHDLQEAYREWQEQGKPEREAYRVEMTEGYTDIVVGTTRITLSCSSDQP